HELCIDETTASAACDDGTTDITPNLMSQYTEHQVCVRTTSTASAWVCDVYGNMDGYHATIRNQLNTTSMTETAPCVNLVGLLEYVWMECGTI
ncbi:MAG: hypothetical protein GTO05_05130, partial [Gemmatimonadales bacterium]|nr:hypothetical protein [Gemmatimonadales bacterium]